MQSAIDVASVVTSFVFRRGDSLGGGDWLGLSSSRLVAREDW